MKFLSLIVWVTQFGFSDLFPTCFFLFLAHWLMTKFGLGMWVMVVLAFSVFLPLSALPKAAYVLC